MTTISETNSSESTNLWKDYSAAEEAINNEIRLSRIGFVALSISFLNNMRFIPHAYMPIATICAIVFPILLIFAGASQIKRFFMVSALPPAVLGVSIATTLFAKTYPLVRFGPPIFGMMCLFSAYLQTMGLTKKRYLELSIGKLKEIIASNEPKKECFLIEKIIKNGNYTYIYLKPEEMSLSDIQHLLLLAYQHKKILCFSSLIDYPLVKTENVHIYNLSHVATFYYDIRLEPNEIWEEIALNVQSCGHDEVVLKAFKRSVDYLIQCKKQNPQLDDAFINEQLAYLSQTWGNFPSATWGFSDFITLRLKPNLSLENGNPVITTRIGELGNITKFKNQLLENFASIELVQESSPAW